MDNADTEIAAHLERVIRRIKSSMNYRGSYTTRDILGSLVARWVHSGEWERLKALPAEERRLGESVRRFILDRLAQLGRRGLRETDAVLVAIPDDHEILEMIELAELRAWIAARIADLSSGIVDERVKIPMPHAVEIGRILDLQLEGNSQRQIAEQLDVSLGLVNKRIAEGTNYLVVLQGIERGLVGLV